MPDLVKVNEIRPNGPATINIGSNNLSSSGHILQVVNAYMIDPY